jgi:hypothetical protein
LVFQSARRRVGIIDLLTSSISDRHGDDGSLNHLLTHIKERGLQRPKSLRALEEHLDNGKYRVRRSRRPED